MVEVKRIEHIATGHENVLTTSPDTTATEVAAASAHDVGCLVVVDGDDRVVGIVTERDIISKVVAEASDARAVHVGDIMTRRVISCTLETSVTRAQQIMARNGTRHLPIIEDGTLVGMISSRDVLQHQLSAVKAIVRRQSKVLRELEQDFPGITELPKDARGRIVIEATD